MYRLNTGKEYDEGAFAELQSSFLIPGRKEDSPPRFVDELFVVNTITGVYDNNMVFRRAGHHKGRWMWWDGKKWEITTPWGSSATSACSRKALIKATSGSRIPDGPSPTVYPSRWDRFDKEPLLATDSGVFYVENGKLAGHGYSKDDYCTQYLPHKISGECPRWLELVDRVLPNKKDQECLQQFFGYVMFPGYHLQTIFHLHGDPGAGKSTVLSVLESILGGTRISHIKLSLVRHDTHGFSGPIVDSWVNIDAETDYVDEIAEKYMLAYLGR